MHEKRSSINDLISNPSCLHLEKIILKPCKELPWGFSETVVKTVAGIWWTLGNNIFSFFWRRNLLALLNSISVPTFSIYHAQYLLVFLKPSWPFYINPKCSYALSIIYISWRINLSRVSYVYEEINFTFLLFLFILKIIEIYFLKNPDLWLAKRKHILPCQKCQLLLFDILFIQHQLILDISYSLSIYTKHLYVLKIILCITIGRIA